MDRVRNQAVGLAMNVAGRIGSWGLDEAVDQHGNSS
jgi:hypothetical protein